ncbi:hypothetical protein, partial [Mesorhizobium sp. M7A.F.Ca.US.005.03.1.1]|uniref:hypothetical protein n=1 Tax=Mesorhizobium sp. M7A.F.Ca.US.005.03.1.1 TaxID=2496736 RepID=UPI0019D2A468
PSGDQRQERRRSQFPSVDADVEQARHGQEHDRELLTIGKGPPLGSQPAPFESPSKILNAPET